MILAWTLETGYGVWHPLALVAVIVIAVVVALAIRALGEKKYKKGTEQTQPFLSGNIEADATAQHIRGSHLYWGYLEAFKGYYDRLTPMHTGVATDYLLWLFGVLVLIMIIGLAT